MKLYEIWREDWQNKLGTRETISWQVSGRGMTLFAIRRGTVRLAHCKQTVDWAVTEHKFAEFPPTLDISQWIG